MPWTLATLQIMLQRVIGDCGKSKDYRLLSLRTSLLSIRFVILHATAFQASRREAS